MSTHLPDFIAETGDDACVELFGVPLRTIQSWRRRERLPRPEQAREIVRLTSGRVTFDGIYGLHPEAADQPAREVA